MKPKAQNPEPVSTICCLGFGGYGLVGWTGSTGGLVRLCERKKMVERKMIEVVNKKHEEYRNFCSEQINGGKKNG